MPITTGLTGTFLTIDGDSVANTLAKVLEIHVHQDPIASNFQKNRAEVLLGYYRSESLLNQGKASMNPNSNTPQRSYIFTWGGTPAYENVFIPSVSSQSEALFTELLTLSDFSGWTKTITP